MDDVFHIIPELKVDRLEEKLQGTLSCQEQLDQATNNLAADLSNVALLVTYSSAKNEAQVSTSHLEAVDISSVNLVHNFKCLEVVIIYRSNRYFTKYGAKYSVENLSSLRTVFSTRAILSSKTKSVKGGLVYHL